MNRLIKYLYLDKRLFIRSKKALWFRFIVYLFQGSMFTFTARKVMLERGTVNFSFWIGVVMAPLFFFYASLDASLLIRKYRRHSNPLPPSQA